MALSLHCKLKISLGQWPSVTGMVHKAPHTRTVHMATGFVRDQGSHRPEKYLKIEFALKKYLKTLKGLEKSLNFTI